MYVLGGGQPLLNKGFTLIELLAVIIILAIIAVIAVPIVLNIIKDTKEKSVKISAQNYLKAVELAITNENINSEFNSSECIIQENGNLLCTGYENEIFIKVDGEKPTKGKIKLNEGKVLENTSLVYDEYGISMNENGELQQFSKAESFASDSWDTIVKNVRAGNIDKYNLGDTKEVKLEGFENTSEEEGTYTLRIANTSTPKECATEGFSQTACGFVVEFVDIISEHNMNPADEYKGVQYSNGWNVDGYPSSSMYKFLNDTTDDTITSIYESLPEDLKYVIIDTKVVSGHGKTAGETNFTSTDKLYILAPKEVYGIKNDYDTLDETRQLDYYNKKEVTTSNCPECVKKYNGSAIFWWLRSPISYTNFQFFGIMATGNFSHGNAKSAEGIVPSFRIG